MSAGLSAERLAELERQIQVAVDHVAASSETPCDAIRRVVVDVAPQLAVEVRRLQSLTGDRA